MSFDQLSIVDLTTVRDSPYLKYGGFAKEQEKYLIV